MSTSRVLSCFFSGVFLISACSKSKSNNNSDCKSGECVPSPDFSTVYRAKFREKPDCKKYYSNEISDSLFEFTKVSKPVANSYPGQANRLTPKNLFLQGKSVGAVLSATCEDHFSDQPSRISYLLATNLKQSKLFDYAESCWDDATPQLPSEVRTNLDNVGLGGYVDYSDDEKKFVLRYQEGEQDPLELAKNLLKKLETVDATRAALYKQKLENLSQFMTIMRGSLTADLGTHALPTYCKVDPVLGVDAKPLTKDKNIYISSRFFVMAADDQAGALLGSLFVWEALSLGNTDLRGARYLNAWLASTPSPASDTYQAALQKASFPTNVTPF